MVGDSSLAVAWVCPSSCGVLVLSSSVSVGGSLMVRLYFNSCVVYGIFSTRGMHTLLEVWQEACLLLCQQAPT